MRRNAKANTRAEYEARIAELEQQLEEALIGTDDGEQEDGGWFRRRRS